MRSSWQYGVYGASSWSAMCIRRSVLSIVKINMTTISLLGLDGINLTSDCQCCSGPILAEGMVFVLCDVLQVGSDISGIDSLTCIARPHCANGITGPTLRKPDFAGIVYVSNWR